MGVLLLLALETLIVVNQQRVLDDSRLDQYDKTCCC